MNGDRVAPLGAHQIPIPHEFVAEDVHFEALVVRLQHCGLRQSLLRVPADHDESLDLAAVDLYLVRHVRAGDQPEAPLLRVGLLVAARVGLRRLVADVPHVVL